MPRTVVLLRHAGTAWNAEERLNSTVDTGLSPTGTAQAAAVSPSLARLGPFGFVRSDARRACGTAAPLAQLVSRSPDVDPRLAEVAFGRFGGKPSTAVTEDPAFRAWHRGEGIAPDGPEALQSAADRATARFLDALERHADASTLVIVSHGGVLRVLLCRVVLQLPASAYRRLVLDNTRVAIVKVVDGDPGLRLAAINVSSWDATYGHDRPRSTL